MGGLTAQLIMPFLVGALLLLSAFNNPVSALPFVRQVESGTNITGNDPTGNDPTGDDPTGDGGIVYT